MSSRVTVSATPDWETWQNVTVWIMSCSNKVVPELDEWHFAFSFCAKISPPDICQLVKEPNSNREKGKKRKKKERKISAHVSAWAEDVHAEGQTLMNAADQIIQNACALKKTPTFPVFDWAAAFVLHWTTSSTEKKHAQAHEKNSIALQGVYSSDLAEISHWNICKQAPLKFIGAFSCLTDFQVATNELMYVHTYLHTRRYIYIFAGVATSRYFLNMIRLITISHACLITCTHTKYVQYIFAFHCFALLPPAA